jgi:hypothetical protein
MPPIVPKEESMIRLSSLFLCSTLVVAAAATSCGAGSSGGEGGNGATGSGGVTTGSGGTSSGSGGAGGGTSAAQDAVSVAPADKEVSGWAVDLKASKNKDGKPMTAFKCDEDSTNPTDPDLISMLIDGGATPFCVDSYRPKLFVWQNYTNGSLPSAPDGAVMSLYVLQYSSTEQATGLYTAVMKLSEYVRKQGTAEDWQPSTMGTESRIQDTGSQWWINFHKGPFYVEVMLDPSYGPAPDFTPADAKLKEEAVRFAKAIADKIK